MHDFVEGSILVAKGAQAISDDSFKYFIAGGIAASFSHGFTVPIDVVKTRLQTDDSLRSVSMFRATTTIVRNEGASALATGLGSTLIGYAIQGSLKYGLYEIFKPLLLAGVFDSRLAAFLAAGAAAELIASSALCPLEATRIRLVADPAYGREVFDALPRLVRETGLGIFSGLPAIYCKQVPYTMAQLAVFDSLTAQANGVLASLGLLDDPAARFTATLCSALAASVVSSLASQPGDAVLSECSRGGSRYGEGVAAVVLGMAAQAPSDFFRGTRARLVHMLAIVTTQLVVYDALKQAMGLSTGH